ncbi:class I SAM-dependent methyltransferase, partial [Escherichia coli]|uniref:class I SAM-dependent methyltransferase n=1 Tax=Escherichia coli TaxID=562 RepID=UPI00301C76BC
FIEADIHHLPEGLQGRFDVALVTIGVLGWMPDVALFMRHAASSRAFLQQARELADISPHNPTFIEADIHHLPEGLQGRFDVALVTIGVLGWMPDVALFMRHAASSRAF